MLKIFQPGQQQNLCDANRTEIVDLAAQVAAIRPDDPKTPELWKDIDRENAEHAYIVFLVHQPNFTALNRDRVGGELFVSPTRSPGRCRATRTSTSSRDDEPMTNPAPGRAPATLDAVLDPDWLTTALGGDAGGRIVGARIDQRLQTVATKVRFTVTVERPDGATAERHYCVKGYFDQEEGRRAGGQGEVAFYREMAPTLSLRGPGACTRASTRAPGTRCSSWTTSSPAVPVPSPPSRRTPARRRPPRCASWPCSTPARGTAPAWARSSGSGSRIAAIPDSFPIDMLQGLLDDGRADTLPAELRDAARVTDAMRRVAARDLDARHCVVHGDAHAGNIYVDPERQPGIVDWQIVHFGSWALDVAYHVAAVLSIEDRRQHERDLLRGYLDELGRLGGQPPEGDEAWTEYRLHLAYGYYLWGITRFVDREITVEFIPRLGTAMDDHGTLAALGA